MKTKLNPGQRVQILNKYNDEIAEGVVTETLHNGFQMRDSSSDEDIHISWRNVISTIGAAVKLNVAS